MVAETKQTKLAPSRDDLEQLLHAFGVTTATTKRAIELQATSSGHNSSSSRTRADRHG